jgi:hypothetical protein
LGPPLSQSAWQSVHLIGVPAMPLAMVLAHAGLLWQLQPRAVCTVARSAEPLIPWQVTHPVLVVSLEPPTVVVVMAVCSTPSPPETCAALAPWWQSAQTSDGVTPTAWQAAQPGGVPGPLGAAPLWATRTSVLWHPELTQSPVAVWLASALGCGFVTPWQLESVQVDGGAPLVEWHRAQSFLCNDTRVTPWWQLPSVHPTTDGIV